MTGSPTAAVFEESLGSESVQPIREPAGMRCCPASAKSEGARRKERRTSDGRFIPCLQADREGFRRSRIVVVDWVPVRPPVRRRAGVDKLTRDERESFAELQKIFRRVASAPSPAN